MLQSRFVTIVVVSIRNALLFVDCAIRKRTPIYLWPEAWRRVKRSHEQEIGRLLTEMVMRGEVKRRIVNGEFRYYPIDKDGI